MRKQHGLKEEKGSEHLVHFKPMQWGMLVGLGTSACRDGQLPALRRRALARGPFHLRQQLSGAHA